MTVRILTGDCRVLLASLAPESVQTVVTSPPYWGLRDYGHDDQLGLERDPRDYLRNMVDVFRLVRRALRNDGTLWMNMGDSYTDGGRGADTGSTLDGTRHNQRESRKTTIREGASPFGLGKKQLIGMPWRLALALQDDGWVLRSDIIWHKPNPMPESVGDRPTKAHEYLFLLAKSERYYYDAEAIKEAVTGNAHARGTGVNPKAKVPAGWDTGEGDHRDKRGRYERIPGQNSRVNVDRVPRPREKQNESFSAAVVGLVASRNKRDVWTVATAPYTGAHFATFPPALIEPCILAGSRRGDTVLDPFGGAGTTGLVADRLGRDAVLCELNPEYAAMARDRIINDGPLFAEVGT